jgi:hypothetical protein
LLTPDMIWHSRFVIHLKVVTTKMGPLAPVRPMNDEHPEKATTLGSASLSRAEGPGL